MTVEQMTMLARRYAVDINLGTTAAPDWQRLKALEEFTPHNEPNVEDDSVYDDEGWNGNVKTALQWSAEAKIKHRFTVASGEVDPVHRHLRNSSLLFGSGQYVGIRYYDIGGPDRDPDPDDAWQGLAIVDWAPEGGPHTNTDMVSLTITGHGKLDSIDNPVGEAQDPVVTSTDPATGAEAGGNLVNIYGSWFVGVTDVEFGEGDSAPQWETVSSNRIVAEAPSGTGTVEVIVTTAAGTSADGPDYVYT